MARRAGSPAASPEPEPEREPSRANRRTSASRKPTKPPAPAPAASRTPKSKPRPSPISPPRTSIPVDAPNARRLRVFVASPGDVNDARNLVPKVLAEINRTRGAKDRVVLETWDWREDARRGLGEPQDLINPALDEAHVVVAIFHDRLGTPTRRAKSGTAEEVLRAIDGFRKRKRPHLLFYICETPTRLKTAEQAKQRGQLLEFLEELPPKIDRHYEDLPEFEEQLRLDLNRWLDDFVAAAARKSTPTRPAARTPTKSPSPARTKPPRFDTTRYFDYVERTYGTVVISGIGTGDAVPALSLRKLYVSLRSSDSESGDPADAATAAQRRRRGLRADGERSIPVEQAFRKNRSLLIEGDPGSGKSTVLFRLALALVDAHAGKAGDARKYGFEPPYPIPVVVPLRRFRAWLQGRPTDGATSDTLVAYLEETVEKFGGASGWLKDRLAKGQIALLLDGLDEVPDAELRKTAADLVKDFVLRDAWSECRLALTSRPSGLDESVRAILRGNGGLAHVVVQPLNDEERAAFVGRWHGAMVRNPDDAETRTRDLLARIARNPSVQRLTDTPIMLTAITVVNFTGGSLPEQRAELYEQCVATMLHKWDEAKGPDGVVICGPLPLRAKQDVFQEIAFETHGQGGDARSIKARRVYAVAAERLKAVNPDCEDPEVAKKLVDYFVPRTGMLLPGDTDHDFVFRHLTFQEFLVARRLCQRGPDVGDFLSSKLDDPWWREVVALTVGYRTLGGEAQALDLLKRLCLEALRRDTAAARVAALAVVGRAMLDVRTYGLPELKALANSIEDDIVRLIEDESRPGAVADRAVIASLLGSFGNPDPRLTPERQWIDVPGGEVWVGEADREQASNNYNPPLDKTTQRVRSFQLQRWATTVGELKRFLDTQPATEFAHLRSGDGAAQFRGPTNLPATFVDLDDATAYCAWASTLPENRGFVVRLPVDDEWELAARGAVMLADGHANPSPKRAYSWGDDFDSLKANVNATDVNEAVPVGLFAGAHGPYAAWDQSGNVWEWTSSPHDRGDSVVRSRPLRGGSFRDNAQRARVSWHGWFGPGDRDSDLGFRPLRLVAE